VTVVDCYKLVDHHKIINSRIPDNEYKMTIIQFSGYLAHQLIANVDYLVSLYSPTSQELRSILSDSVNAPNSISVETPESTSTLTFGDNLFLSLRVLKDANQDKHHQIAFDITTSSKGKKRTKTRMCVRCIKEESKHRLVGFGCYTCGIALCCPNASNKEQDCFLDHIQAVCQRLNRQSISS
jgi:hypothetical protein